MNLKKRMYRVSDDTLDEINARTPEGQKRSAAMKRLENWAEHFKPTILSEDWSDDEHCTVVLGDKNSSVKMTINCVGTYNEGLLDWGIVDTYDHRKNWKGMPDDDWFLVNAINIKLTHDDRLSEDLRYTIDDFLGENLVFGSDDSDEIYDSRRVSDNWWNDKNDRFWWGIHIEYKNGVMSDGGDKDLNSDEEAIERASKLAAQGNNNIAVVEAYRVDLPENETLGTIKVLKHIDVMDI